MSPNKDHLDIAILGAGIAGLATGLTLCKAGHNVTIYERSQFKNEVGAAINMPPQAARILRSWGIAGPNPTPERPYQDMAGGTPMLSSTSTLGKTGDVLAAFSLDGVQETYGSHFISYHRADLHSGLRKLAEEAGVVIVLGKTATEIDPKSGTLKLSDSSASTPLETIQKDLIVVADGVNSSFVKTITNQDIPIRNSGKSAYRTLIPLEKTMADPIASQTFKDGAEKGLNGSMNPQAGVFMVMYPCRRNEVLNVAILHPLKEEEEGKRDWNSPATLEEVLESLEGHEERYKAVVKCADPDSIRVYPLLLRDPLPTYHNHRAIILGDAAHPMLPTIAGGGSTALEDAAALSILLSPCPSTTTPLTNPQTLQQRLALWNALRLPRDAVSQVMSTALLTPGSTQEGLREQLDWVYQGDFPKRLMPSWQDEMREFVCTYDVFDVTRKALEWAESEGYDRDLLMRLQREGGVRHFGRQD